MSPAVAAPFLRWSKWSPVRLWSCVLLYWLYPGLSCTDDRQINPAALHVTSAGPDEDNSPQKHDFTFNHQPFIYSLKNDSLIRRLNYLQQPDKVLVDLDFSSLTKFSLHGEMKKSLCTFSSDILTLPIKLTVLVNTPEPKNLQIEHVSGDSLLNSIHQIQLKLDRKLLFFFKSYSSRTAHTLSKFICFYFRCLCSLEINGSWRHIISVQQPKTSSILTHKQKRLSPIISFIQKRRHYRIKAPPRRPREEFVYGQDDRRRISSLLIWTFPYSNVVRLSTGCTGTLLTPHHVLTAAHCVHNGHGFRQNLEMMRVKVSYPMGLRVFYIEKISIPSRWRHPRIKQEHQEAWDYAVVTLINGVHGRSRFYPLAVSTTAMIENDLIFLAFMKEQSGLNHLWISKCPGQSNKPLVDRSLIFTHCDSAIGNSGAAILAKDGATGRKIIGVLSSTIQVRQSHRSARTDSNRKSFNKTIPRRRLSFSVITALTWPKLWDICRELGNVGIAYGVCPKPQYIPVKNRHLINNIPFFG